MKKVLALICTVAVLALSSCGVQWENAAYVEYTCPDELRLITSETVGDSADVLEAIGLSSDGALTALKDGQMFFTSFYPVKDEEGKTTYPIEMFLMVDYVDFADNIFDLNRLSEEEREENIKQMMSTEGALDDGYDVSSVDRMEINGVTYIKYDYSAVYNEETQYVSQYTTIYNGFLYNFFCISTEVLSEEVASVRDEFVSSIKFTKTLEAPEEYDPNYDLFTHSVARFLRKNWIAMIVVAVVTIGLTVFFLVYHEKHKNDPVTRKKKDGVVRAEYLK